MSASSLRCGCQAPHCRIEAAASTITPGQPALLRLPPYFLHHANMSPTGHCLVVDTRVEMITHLNTTHADGEWGEGEVIDIEVHFTAPVVLVGLAAGREGVFFGTGGAGMSLVLDVVRKESSNTVILTRAPPDQPASPPPRHSTTPPLRRCAAPRSHRATTLTLPQNVGEGATVINPNNREEGLQRRIRTAKLMGTYYRSRYTTPHEQHPQQHHQQHYPQQHTQQHHQRHHDV